MRLMILRGVRIINGWPMPKVICILIRKYLLLLQIILSNRLMFPCILESMHIPFGVRMDRSWVLFPKEVVNEVLIFGLFG